MSEEDLLIKVYEGRIIPGYTVIEVGIDHFGKYKLILTPDNGARKVYGLNYRAIEKVLMDRYNKLHNFRRHGDFIRLYYHTGTKTFIILAVLPGDNLSGQPFNISTGFTVTQKILDDPEIRHDTGLIPVTKENLQLLVDMDIIDEEISKVLYFNRNNVGFYL